MCDTENKYLLDKASKGDIASFERLIVDYEKLIYNIALRKLLNREDAKDAAQDVLIKIYKNLDKCDTLKSFKAWICTITINTCTDYLRKRKNNIDSLDDMPWENITSKEHTPEDIYIAKEKKSIINQAINELSPDHKDLIILRDIQGLSYQELSEATGIPVGTVKSRLARARGTLQKLITDKSV